MTDDLRQATRVSNAAVKQLVQTRDDRLKAAKRRNTSVRDVEANEVMLRKEEANQYHATIPADTDRGTNTSGLYELCGRPAVWGELTEAMVTHKGASADSGKLTYPKLTERTLYRLGAQK